jgi:dihydrofolate reductase
MAGYRTTPAAMKNDPIVAGLMNSLPKIVLSRTLKGAAWSNTTLIKENAAEEMMKLKAQKGKDIGILGSANLAASLMRQNLIDEYRIMVNPIVLGEGNPLFGKVDERIRLRLLRTRDFKSGNVLLCYMP